MTCVKTPKFSITLCGELHGFFANGRGLRQEDPLSPYLFTLVMEVLSGILTTHSTMPEFKYYWRCKATSFSHLFFADDIFLFCEAYLPLMKLFKEGLQIFSNWSELVLNTNKSEVYLVGDSPSLRNQILLTLGFLEGSLPARYLRIPFITSRISKVDWCVLANCITVRIQSWTHRFLSFIGWLQLIMSILHAIQAYWASVFILLATVLDQIEWILKKFLWKGPELGRGGAKVSWEDVCCPKDEGALGFEGFRSITKPPC